MIRLILLILLIIAVLSYLNFSIKNFIEGESFQNNFNYVWGWVKYIWNNYLSRPFKYFWNDFIIKLLWQSFILNLERVRNGQPIQFMEWPPQSP